MTRDFLKVSCRKCMQILLAYEMIPQDLKSEYRVRLSAKTRQRNKTRKAAREDITEPNIGLPQVSADLRVPGE